MKQFRYNSINEALKKRFGCKVYKVTLESGFTCPNRDGTIGDAGCIFCAEESYEVASPSPSARTDPQSINEVLREGINYVQKRHNAKKFISYFQNGANTNGPVQTLKEILYASIDHPDVVGLAIATRADCIKDEHIDLFSGLNRQTMLWVEMGLQSSNDNTLKILNRGHTVSDFEEAAKRLMEKGISVCAHVILGLPGESEKDMQNTAAFLNRTAVWGVKIHNLHILKGTVLEKWYKEGRLKTCDLAAYAKWAADFLERLDPSILIHRVNGHAPRHLTVAPEWSINKLAIFNAVEKELRQRNSWQGKKL